MTKAPLIMTLGLFITAPEATLGNPTAITNDATGITPAIAVGDVIHDAQFVIKEDETIDNAIAIDSIVTVESTCIQIGYDIRRIGAFTHEVDYYVEETGEFCLDVLVERSARLELGGLTPGRHLVSLMGPDGKDLRVEISVGGPR